MKLFFNSRSRLSTGQFGIGFLVVGFFSPFLGTIPKCLGTVLQKLFLPSRYHNTADIEPLGSAGVQRILMASMETFALNRGLNFMRFPFMILVEFKLSFLTKPLVRF
ncbi:Hypothetical membrane protein [Zobellia galactanivorans]|uniref:Hypothetical membrane protein n=1 Tax=Zobellia galactanivorans (strain DSM 12802 / CCUG 47099 / CIP 106680 / NCIMB 13871 / Dsij) TaxID=63186 RepID=G0LBU2_ZOBGA|nr:Hypothetical membrane protein [Zobellia galactanivorans]